MNFDDFNQVVQLLASVIGTDDLKSWALGGLLTGVMALIGWTGARASVSGTRLLWSATLGALAVAAWRRWRPQPSELAGAILKSLENEAPQVQRFSGERVLRCGRCSLHLDRFHDPCSRSKIQVGGTLVDDLLPARDVKAILRKAKAIARELQANDDEQTRKLLTWRILDTQEDETVDLAQERTRAPKTMRINQGAPISGGGAGGGCFIHGPGPCRCAGTWTCPPGVTSLGPQTECYGSGSTGPDAS